MRLLFFEIKGSSIAVILVTAVFLSAIFFGASRGKAVAVAESSFSGAKEIQKGLDYFYKDQNRFPTVEELFSTNIALTYFSTVPSDVSETSVCQQNFSYSRLSLNSYQLDFCLAVAVEGYQRGWNRIIEQK